MGDPKKHRKKYSAPSHPWQKSRIDEEKPLMTEYGFKNKTELWKMDRFLKNATHQAKKLITLSGAQADKEKALLLDRLRRYGLISTEAGLPDILSISLRDVLERRLQTQVYKQNLANSVKQARQFITHEHITVDEKVVTSPSYIVSVSEASHIVFKPTSTLSDEEHPERVAARKVEEKESNVLIEKDNQEGSNKDSKTKDKRISKAKPGNKSDKGKKAPKAKK